MTVWSTEELDRLLAMLRKLTGDGPYDRGAEYWQIERSSGAWVAIGDSLDDWQSIERVEPVAPADLELLKKLHDDYLTGVGFPTVA